MLKLKFGNTLAILIRVKVCEPLKVLNWDFPIFDSVSVTCFAIVFLAFNAIVISMVDVDFSFAAFTRYLVGWVNMVIEFHLDMAFFAETWKFIYWEISENFKWSSYLSMTGLDIICSYSMMII